MLLLCRGVEGNPFNYEKHIANSLLILQGRPEGLKREYAWNGMEGWCKAERRNTGFAQGLYCYSSISSSTYNPRFEVGNLHQKWNFRQENRFHVWNWKSWWGTESMLCIQECTPVETWLKMFLKQDGWNEVKEFVSRGRSITAMGCNVRRLKKAVNGRYRSNCLSLNVIGLCANTIQ